MSSSESNVPPGPLPPDAEMLREQFRYQLRVRNIARAVKKEECILFLGSAIHAPAPHGSNYRYAQTECPPFGSHMSELLAVKCGYPYEDRDNLPRVSWYYEMLSGFRADLVHEVRELLEFETQPQITEPGIEGSAAVAPIKLQPSPVLNGLARLAFPIVITTNYDQLYECALDLIARERARAEGRSEAEIAATKAAYKKSVYSPVNTVATEDCDKKPSASCPYLLKIHGDLDRSDSIVITDEDYIQFVLRMADKELYNPVPHNVKFYLKTRPILFIGYRLHDYNLRLLFKTLRRQLGEADIPPSFAVDKEPDVLIRDTWDSRRGYIRFIEKNLWDFVPDLYREVTGEEMPQ